MRRTPRGQREIGDHLASGAAEVDRELSRLPGPVRLVLNILTAGQLGALGCGVVFLGSLLLLMLVVSVSSFLEQRQRSVEVAATVTMLEIGEPYKSGEYQAVPVVIEYEFRDRDGAVISGDLRTSITLDTRGRGVRSRLENEGIVDLRYDPANPDDAVLAIHSGGGVLIMAIAIVMNVCLWVVLFALYKGRKDV